MVTITLHCPYCQSDALVRNGHAPNGKQLYRCRTCGRQSRENPTPNAYPEARREEILHASSRTQQFARPHPYVWGLSHHGVQVDQKKVAQLPPLSTTLVAPDPEDAASSTLLWAKRPEKRPMWSAGITHDDSVWLVLSV